MKVISYPSHFVRNSRSLAQSKTPIISFIDYINKWCLYVNKINYYFFPAETLSELRDNLKEVIEVLTQTEGSVTSISSGCELFLRFITLASLDNPVCLLIGTGIFIYADHVNIPSLWYSRTL